MITVGHSMVTGSPVASGVTYISDSAWGSLTLFASLCLFSGPKFIWSLRGLVRLRAAIGVQSTLRPPKYAHTTFSISAP
jgi:hypothetical protein